MERQLYFSMGEESPYTTLCLRRRRPVLVVATAPHPEHPTLVVPDVQAAYHRLMRHLRHCFDCRFVVVAGGENKTATAELLTGTLGSAYRVFSGTADHAWLQLHPSHDFCVQELRGGPLGDPQLEPEICVLTSYIEKLPPLAENTRIFYNGSDEKLSAMMKTQPHATAFWPAASAGLRQELAAGAAVAVAQYLGIAAPEDRRYSGMEQNVFTVDGMTVLTDYACKSEAAAKASLAVLAGCPGKKIALVEAAYASFAQADVVLAVPQPSSERPERIAAELQLEK
ncbi:MAG: hypothetical protein IIY16_02805, partial [Oscillospiraceae bacterium]|nr:hypothetical protein [Oscillospiraceae bacterium]